MRETLTGVTFDVLEDIEQKRAGPRVCEGLVAIEAAHYVSIGAEIFGKPVFNTGKAEEFFKSPVRFALDSISAQYPERTTAPREALQLGILIAKSEGKMTTADYLQIMERGIDSPLTASNDLSEEQIRQHRNQGD